MTRRLLVFDRYDISWLARAVETTGPSDEWDLLLLGLSGARFHQRHATCLAQLPTWRMVDLASLASRAHELVNGFVLELIPRLADLDLGGETLAELLEVHGGNEWWYLQTAEKNPLRDRLIGQLYAIALTRLTLDEAEYDEVWVSLSEVSLRETLVECGPGLPTVVVLPTPARGPKRWWDRFPLLRYWIHAAAALGNFLLIRMIMRIGRLPVLSPEPDGVFFFTIYPYWWLNPFDQDATDRFFPRTPDTRPSQYLAWLVWPVHLWRRRCVVTEVIGSRQIVILQRFLRVGEAISVLSPMMFRRTWRFERRLRPHVAAEFLGFDVGRLIGQDLSRSLTGSELFLDRLLSRAARNFALAAAPRSVVYRVEFQPSENALLFGLGSGTQRIGFLHSPFGGNFLPMRFGTGELIRYVQAKRPERDRPLPDGMLVCSKAGVRRLTEDGYPADRIATCGPQRHAPFADYLGRRQAKTVLRSHLGLRLNALVIVVAIAMIEAETDALFCAIVQACEDWDDFQLVIKTHPNKPEGDSAVNAAVASLGRERASFLPAKANMYDYIAAADTMICIGSTVAFEAMALGVMPIVFENPATFAGTSLAAYQYALFVARDAADLRTAVADVRGDSARACDRHKHWPKLLEDVFGDFRRPLPEQLDGAFAELGVARTP